MRILASICISLVLLAAAARAQVVADLQADFSVAAQGTNGIQYGNYTSANSTTGTFTTAGWVVSGSPGVWYGGESLGTPAISMTINHPALDTLNPAVRRYTIGSSGEPSLAGFVEISGMFYDQASGPTSGFITVDGVNLFNMVVPNTGDSSGFVTFDITVLVAPGSTIDFGVNAGTDAYSDSTGVTATITVVPEPSTMSLFLLAGGSSLALFCRRRAVSRRA
jgi:hypothetical protein